MCSFNYRNILGSMTPYRIRETAADPTSNIRWREAIMWTVAVILVIVNMSSSLRPWLTWTYWRSFTIACVRESCTIWSNRLQLHKPVIDDIWSSHWQFAMGSIGKCIDCYIMMKWKCLHFDDNFDTSYIGSCLLKTSDILEDIYSS